MLNDIYYQPTKIIFGKGVENDAGAEIAKHADTVLLHYGGSSAEKSGLLDRVRESLNHANITFYELGGVQPNPRLDLVNKGIALCRDKGVELVLAVGGGSVIDSSKAIATGAKYDGEVWELFTDAEKTADEILPVATVLTIPGAGSESSSGMVVTNIEEARKLSYDDDKARPVVSFLNPELTTTVPKWHTAAGVADAMAHVFERYFTNTKYVDVTDRMSEGLLKSLMKYGKMVMDNPEDYDVRAEIMWACKLAHDGSLGMGKEEDWASHNIGHELSALYDVSHGASLTVVFPAWMEYVYTHDIGRFLQFAIRVMDVEYDKDFPDAMVKEAIQRLKSFFQSIEMPTSLRELGLKDQSSIRQMAESAIENSGGNLGSFVALDVDDVEKILTIAY